MDDIFAGLVGNDPIKRYLTRMIEKEAVAQSLLFAGPEGVGKSLFAARFAQHIVGAIKPQHPDIYHYYTEGKIGMHSIQTMREFSQEVYLAPYSAPKKVFIIHDAHRMLTYGANALLKTFEEPPPSSIIILLSHSPEHLLPTILSRCQTVRFVPIRHESLVEELCRKKGLPHEQAHGVAVRAQGSLGKAEQLLNEEGSPLRARLLDALSAGTPLVLSQVKELAQQIQDKLKAEEEQLRAQALRGLPEELSAVQKQTLEKEVEGCVALQKSSAAGSLFEILLSWYRDLHLLHAGADPRFLINADYRPQLEQALQRGEMLSLEVIETSISKANIGLQRSLPLESCLESLFLRLR